MASGNGNPPPIGGVNLDVIMDVITNTSQRMEEMEGHVSTIQGSVSVMDGRMINVEARINYTNTTPQTTY